MHVTSLWGSVTVDVKKGTSAIKAQQSKTRIFGGELKHGFMR